MASETHSPQPRRAVLGQVDVAVQRLVKPAGERHGRAPSPPGSSRARTGRRNCASPRASPVPATTELKTKKSRRILCLTPELVNVIRAHRTAHNRERLQAGESWTESGLMFPTTFGNPSDPDTFSHLFSKLAKKADLGHWRPHELRHSGASLMLAQGTPLHVVSDVLGHASIAITKDIYGHLMEGDKRAATEAISGSAGEIQAGGSHRGGRHRVTMESTRPVTAFCLFTGLLA
jgi:hypothetical protein